MNFLINSLELLSNQKSFVLGVGCTRTNLWLLLHLKDLKIKKYKICYQVNNGIRQRQTTEHPKRWLKKNFLNTAELLEHLNTKLYDIHYLEIEFLNSWKVKEQPHIQFKFYTNSITERNNLIDKFIATAGFKKVDLSKLRTNISYYFSVSKGLYTLDNEVLPDEFWSEEDKIGWRKKTIL
jgi:hypothetical protein